MYTILDPDLQVCGILDLNGKGCKFYNDLRSTKIADDQGKIWVDTLDISVPYGYRETDYMTFGYHLLKQADDGFFYCYRIGEPEDDVVGPTHVKRVHAINLLAWDLTHKIVPAKTFKAANSQDAFEYILQQTGWEIGDNDFFGGVKTLEFNAGQNAQYWLDNLTSQFSVEIRAHVQVHNGKVIRKLVDIVEELGESEGRRLEYSHDLIGLTRKGSDQEMYTKLYVYGGTNSKGQIVSIASVNNGREYILDEDANDIYNNGGDYLEGYIVNDQILNPSGLLDWGKTQFKKFNHPKFNYTVDVAYLGYTPNLGDHIQVVDFSMQPELTIAARVIQLDESEANPTNNKVILGEFIEIVAVTPAIIWELRAKAAQAAQEAAQAKSYKIDYSTPDGTDFADSNEKRIIIRVYEGREDITAKIPESNFVWQKINTDGSHDTNWEKRYLNAGNVIYVGNEVVGSTIRCQINDEISDPIIFATEEDAAYFLTFPMNANGIDGVNRRVVQYAQIDHPRNHVYYSQVYGGKTHRPPDYQTTESFELSRCTIDGTYMDSMLCLHGGHGSHFGIEYVNNKLWIWSLYRNPSNLIYHVVKFPYQPGKIIDWGDSSIVDMLSFSTTGYRVNLDVRNGYVLFVNGIKDPAFYVCKKSDVEKKVYKPIYTARGSDINYFGVEQTYQSACLDFPYVYMTSGSADIDDDQKCLYCFDIRSKSLVYRIVYTFDKGTIEPIGAYRECETISYYYDSNGKKWLIQGFGFSNENVEESQKTNQLFRINEHKRGD
ncbi:phage tail spike protein [Heyndrickxia sporothermodurans]|uniref:phage tail spike protein n=1 Tax=Heyndrickxia sporothermodurans TaxID=46224 RepID=UPI002E2025CC|nr:phage tail spike protein [Heyndrickxia sporothermodurans]MED3650603.1 phage tail spike protein [Heyndrickxia sporothermodurans]MED3697367.1 phage tail spike protein [Heyndrickxia sporothermodurans]